MTKRDKPMKKDEARAMGRRALIKWSLAAGAALGLPRWKVFEVLELTGGKALAQQASCTICNRSVHIIAGRGGIAWFTLLWPHNDIAAGMPSGASLHASSYTMATGTDRPLTLAPETPFQSFPGARQVTALLAGTNETHTRTPASNASLGMSNGLFAACAAVQTASPTLTPVIAVDDAPYTSASGAPRVARVGSASDIISLFNSAASRAGGLLSNTDNANLFASSYSSWVELQAAAGLPTTHDGYQTGVASAQLLGKNLANALQPTDADFMRYGIDGSSPSQNRDIAETLIITAKAFTLGLTNSVIFPAFDDDPHAAFADMGTLMMTVQTLGKSLDAFYADLNAQDDPTCAGTSIGDNTVLSIHGDTPKDPLTANNWPDSTPGNSNWMYVLGAGQLKTGWFGGIDRSGNVTGWNPATGAADASMSSSSTSSAAAAAVLYAVTKGDIRRLQDFYRDSIQGVINSPTT